MRHYRLFKHVAMASLAFGTLAIAPTALAAVKVTTQVSGPGTVSGMTMANGDSKLTATPSSKGADFSHWSTPLPRGVTCLLNTCTVSASYYAKQSAAITLTANFKAGTAYLFLHGLNSNVNTWNDVVKARFNNSCTTISNGTDVSSAANTQRCFRVSFATRIRAGLGNTTWSGLLAQTSWPNGDGATYSELGAEVTAAVGKITKYYPGIGAVILVGHSRGGLAGRAALKDSASSLTKVKGLLTIGTPHNGSAFGRVYSWLASNPPPTKKSCKNKLGIAEYCTTAQNGMASEKDRADAWNTVSNVRSASTVVGLPLDMRAPSIDYLAIGSAETNKLAQGRLPSSVKYGMIASNYVIFGNVVGVGNILDTLPQSTRTHILNGQTQAAYRGDGIVHLASQQALPGACAYMTLSNILHKDETKQSASILKAMDEVANPVQRCIVLQP